MSVMADPSTRYIDKLYGRRQSKPLKPRQAQLMETLLPAVSLPISTTGSIDLSVVFPAKEAFELEIGFGGGEHLAWQAAQRPNTGFIGAEPFLNGVGKLLSLISEQGLLNIRVVHGDARPCIEALPENALSRIYLLHPDPWPKRKHFKRRMVSPWFLGQAVRLLVPGGELRVASDIPDYIRWTLMHARNEVDLEWAAERASDWRDRPADWPGTRYEAKARREGRTPTYLLFRKRRS